MNLTTLQAADQVIPQNNSAAIRNNAERRQEPLPGARSADGQTLAGGAGLPANVFPSPAGRATSLDLSIHKRRELLSQAVEMVANGIAPSLIVVGQPGLGKTHEVFQTLQAMALEPEHDYFYVKGFSSARGLFETLYAFNGQLIVFDDCDSALKDGVSAEILKGALDSHQIRIISWLTAAKTKSRLPKTFRFEGQVIFISNRPVADIDEAILARSLVIDYHMSREEILEYLEAILFLIESAATSEQRRAGLEFIRKWAPSIRRLSIRTLVSVLRIIKAHPTNWMPLAI